MSAINKRIRLTLKWFVVIGTCLFTGSMLLDSCGGKDIELANLGINLDSAYTMRTTDVDMLISDSGIVRYRLKSLEWLIYDNESRRQWVFPEGLKLETYDTIRSGSTLVEADSAINHLDTEVWELIGNVKLKGLDGELLATPHLYWDRIKHKLYSFDTTYFQKPGEMAMPFKSFEAKDDLSVYDTYGNKDGSIFFREGQSSKKPDKIYGVAQLKNSEQTDSLQAVEDRK